MRRVGTFTWPGPVSGWVVSNDITNVPIDAAERLDNIFPTREGGQLRRGASLHATVSAAPVQFFQYEAGDQQALFVSTETEVIDVTSPVAPDEAETAALQGFSSGDWSQTQFGTSGGEYSIAVNGADNGLIYDGTTLNPLADEAITDLAYDALTGAFTIGQTVTGGTSGATAKILGIAPTLATTGTLKVGVINGTFQDNEALTDPLTGAATSNIASGTSLASTITITGKSLSDLCQVWAFKERLFFVEKNSLSAWYLPAGQIGGALTEINLAGVFSEGGSLMFGANWSLDSGEGLDDKCVFVTNKGEVAIYSGIDPSSASTWALQGVYRIGAPVNKHAAFAMGGELMVVSEDGILPISQAIGRSYADLLRVAYTGAIEPEWRRQVGDATSSDPIVTAHWRSKGALYVAVPGKINGKGQAFVANTKTGGRWCRYLGWRMLGATVFEDQLYFGTDAFEILKGEVGGTDNGTSYQCEWVPKFSNLGGPNKKFANHVGVIARSGVSIDFTAKVFANYSEASFPVANNLPAPTNAAAWDGGATWDSGVKWNGDQLLTGQQKWKTAYGSGFALAPGIAISSNSVAPPRVEITTVMMRYEVGNIL